MIAMGGVIVGIVVYDFVVWELPVYVGGGFIFMEFGFMK